MKNKQMLVYINGKRYNDASQISIVRENAFDDEKWREFNKLHRNFHGHRPVSIREKFFITFEGGRRIEFVPTEYLKEGPVWWFETEEVNEIQQET